MPRLKALSNQQAQAKTQTLFAGVEKKLGTVPNIMRTMGNSAAVLEAYLGFSGALGKGVLTGKLREQIALVVGESNACDYCLAAHSALGRAAGLDDAAIADSRRADSTDARTRAALRFARKLVLDRGHANDGDVEELRRAGFDDAGIAEIVANVAINIFTNYFNHVAETDVDFPKVQPAACGAACATVA